MQTTFKSDNEVLMCVRRHKTAILQATVYVLCTPQTVLCQLEPNPQAVSESESTTTSPELVLDSLGGVLGML
jgi:hypothetical protein